MTCITKEVGIIPMGATVLWEQHVEQVDGIRKINAFEYRINFKSGLKVVVPLNQKLTVID